jgi:hypothetical protein
MLTKYTKILKKFRTLILQQDLSYILLRITIDM